MTFTDANARDIHAASFTAKGSGYLGTFSINSSNIDSNGSVRWSFSVADSTIDYLKAGQSLTQYYDVTIDDGHGGFAIQTVTVTLNGADDANVTAIGRFKNAAKNLSNDIGKSSDQDHGPHDQDSTRYNVFEEQIPISRASGVEPVQPDVVDYWHHWLLT